eukprot:5582527-Prymnesium_polylepis.1
MQTPPAPKPATASSTLPLPLPPLRNTGAFLRRGARAQGNVLTYTVNKEAAPDEEAKSRRWVEPDGVTMRAESYFRKNASKPWAKLYRTWTLVPGSNTS